MKRIFSFVLAIIFVISMLFTAVSVSAAALDTSELEEAIEQAQQELANSSQYTDTSFTMFQNAYNEAVITLENAEFENCTQTDIDSAASKLLERIDSLTLAQGNNSEMDSARTQLQATIDKAKSMKIEDYNITTQDWNEFQSMISESETALGNMLFSQIDIQIFNSNLESVIQQIEAKKKNTDSTEAQGSGVASESVAATQSATASQATTPATEKVTKVYPKYTAPISQGGFVYLGCDASVALSALAVVGIIGAAIAIKKKED